MELISVIPVIFIVAAMLAWVTKIDLAYLFAPAIFLISGWEFIFGLLGYLNLGMEFLVLLIGVTLLVFIVRSGEFRSHLLKSSYAPSAVAFVSLSLISLYKSKDWVLSQWDEFTHWGLVVKGMYEYSTLSPNTPIEMVAEKTPPGISLFHYFVMDFSAEWREGLLFWATHLIVTSIMVSVLAKSSYKYLSEIFLKLFIAFAASSVFFNNFESIYADPILALTYGFLLFVAIQASRLDGRWAIVLALTAGFVTLTKATGIYFAVSAILINIVATLFTSKGESVRRKLFSFIPAVIALVTVGAVWIIWRYYAIRFGTSIVGPNDTFPAGFNNMTNQEEVIANYIGAFFETYINPSYSASLSSLHWTIICAVFFVIWALLNGKQNRRQNIAIGVTLIVTTAGYFGAILLAYLTEFGPGEATNLASYARYIGTWYQGIFFATLMLILSEFSLAKYFEPKAVSEHTTNSLSVSKQVSLFLAAFLALVSFSSIMSSIIFLRTDQFKGVQYRAPFIPVKDAIESANIPERSKVWIIAQHSVGFEYYVLRYEMSEQQFGGVPWSIGSPNGEGDIWTDSRLTARSWSHALREFDYVVLYSASEQFYGEFGSLFESGKIDTNSVYKVVKTENDVSLSKVN
jgi:hypothetical protein